MPVENNFQYDKNSVTTQTELKVSVADLRDLIQASSILNVEQRLNEYELILNQISRKNYLPSKSLTVK